MTTTAMKPEDFTQTHIRASVKAYLVARAYADTLREEADRLVYMPALFDGDRPIYHTDPKNLAKGRKAEPITDPRRAWLMSEEDFADYNAECQHRIHELALTRPVFRTQADGNCPALEADNLRRIAENNLLEACEPITGMPPTIYLDNRKRYIDLVCTLTVSQGDAGYFKL